MDFRIAQNAALSGLLVTETRTAVASTNIANADVAGYTAKTTTVATTYAGGSATGVDLTGISSYVDENLVKSMIEAATDASYTEQLADYLESLTDAVGGTDSDSTLANRVTELQTALEALAVTPESESQKYLVVEAAVAVAEELNALSEKVQTLRTNADEQIAIAVDELNEALETIDVLNQQIAGNQALGIDTLDLEDSRRVALGTVAEKLDVTYFTTSSGELHVYTASGQPLVDSRDHPLEYTAAGVVTANMSYPGDFAEIILFGNTVTTGISGGEIGALLELRDEILPAVQEELDALASALSHELNTIHNQGTAIPGAASLTATTSVDPADTLSATGTMRIALIDSDGDADTVVDLDLSTYATYQDLADDINAVPGISASFDAEGRLVISSDDASLGLAINEMDSAVGAESEGISSFFGLNDLFDGSSASTLRVRTDLASDSNLLAVATLSSDAGLAAGDTAVALGDGSIADSLEEVLASSVAFVGAGSLPAASTTLAEYSSDILSDIATRASVAESEAEVKQSVAEDLSAAFSNETGVNLDEETARLAELENLYAAYSHVFQIIQEMFESLLEAASA